MGAIQSLRSNIGCTSCRPSLSIPDLAGNHGSTDHNHRNDIKLAQHVPGSAQILRIQLLIEVPSVSRPKSAGAAAELRDVQPQAYHFPGRPLGSQKFSPTFRAAEAALVCIALDFWPASPGQVCTTLSLILHTPNECVDVVYPGFEGVVTGEMCGHGTWLAKDRC